MLGNETVATCGLRKSDLSVVISHSELYGLGKQKFSASRLPFKVLPYNGNDARYQSAYSSRSEDERGRAGGLG